MAVADVLEEREAPGRLEEVCRVRAVELGVEVAEDVVPCVLEREGGARITAAGEHGHDLAVDADRTSELVVTNELVEHGEQRSPGGGSAARRRRYLVRRPGRVEAPVPTCAAQRDLVVAGGSQHAGQSLEVLGQRQHDRGTALLKRLDEVRTDGAHGVLIRRVSAEQVRTHGRHRLPK